MKPLACAHGTCRYRGNRVENHWSTKPQTTAVNLPITWLQTTTSSDPSVPTTTSEMTYIVSGGALNSTHSLTTVHRAVTAEAYVTMTVGFQHRTDETAWYVRYGTGQYQQQDSKSSASKNPKCRKEDKAAPATVAATHRLRGTFTNLLTVKGLWCR